MNNCNDFFIFADVDVVCRILPQTVRRVVDDSGVEITVVGF